MEGRVGGQSPGGVQCLARPDLVDGVTLTVFLALGDSTFQGPRGYIIRMCP